MNKKQSSPWNEIPLEDYEKHMSHNSVGQLEVLNTLTKKYLSRIKPKTCLFLGVAGGNGLGNIDNSITQNVFGIDINQDYLNKAKERYGETIASLELINFDITSDKKVFCKADFIWAGLVLEYTGIDKSLDFSINNLQPDGNLIVSIQSNNGVQSVSRSGIESVQKVGSIFQLIDPEILIDKAVKMGLKLIENEESFFPNGKSLKTFHFKI
ncbi:putative TPR repeat methyltransferase [Flavobacterium sp. HSC-32F16]|uniref:class I SAM-dependent methyltransferase n=1 Tax=Flavobacterium sp. HSC-32F16 TaxID=2910964 RepID=UPI0020A570F2|nr:class I SAM-dependent methyltransferase [Flavobacterium sp. HSC-32F16]MCP2024946.1 putative TPR repeat methyltransferase [Flavobacterium sp. HSC-32F16]